MSAALALSVRPKVVITESIVFVDHLSVFIEENPVVILGDRKARAKETPIVRDATHDHIGFQDLPAGEIQSVFPAVLLAFPQREGTELNLAGDAVMQAAVVHHDIVYDPGRGTATHDKDDILSSGSPGIPEMIQGTDEIGFGRIHPRQFVDEYHRLISAKNGH